jgi:hypothetical protein
MPDDKLNVNLNDKNTSNTVLQKSNIFTKLLNIVFNKSVTNNYNYLTDETKDPNYDARIGILEHLNLETVQKLQAMEAKIEYYKMFSVIEIAQNRIIDSGQIINEGNIRAILDISKNYSDDEMKEYLASVLAEEYNNPNSISRKTTQIISNFTNFELKLFQKYAPLCILNNQGIPEYFFRDKDILSDLDMSYSEIIELIDLGLVSPTISDICLVFENITNEMILQTFKMKLNEEYIFLRKDNKLLNKISLSAYCLTKTGEKLITLLKFNTNVKYLEWVRTQLDTINVNLYIN